MNILPSVTFPVHYSLNILSSNVSEVLSSTELACQTQNIPYCLESTCYHEMVMFCIVTNSFPGSSLAVAAAAAVRCFGGFHIKWNTTQTILSLK